MKTFITIAALYFIVGCSALEALADYGAKANDEAVRDSKFILCKGASIGAILRAFDTKEEAQGWIQICLGDEKEPFIITEAVD